MKHTYKFEFDGRSYSVEGTAHEVPDFILLPNRRVVRVTGVHETYPPKIAAVVEIPVSVAADGAW